ncbi:adenylate/guanylate cyclase domain-containing protein [Ramlibacter humi]|uniref:Adenylate/guanylate cyclase domain-containing protein n=1 Tax=Ramlibacter humi TaxID=2530451 RepID=A0A4Z0BHJ5_9BURK|nr:adenylate/guanylate cyclase domain-containing protein [Ramlibacter humi]TFY98260.1 adenylate/guanylate cyclase domain-containing protein [Ramlibacter humi]
MTPLRADAFTEERRTRVIVLLDVVESVRLMEGDEPGFIRRWQQFMRQARDQVLPPRGGRILKSTGDGLMLEFHDTGAAVGTSFELLRLCGEAAGAEPLRLRIAAHVAQFVADEFDIYGSDVNLAARLVKLAAPGELYVSHAVRELLDPDLATRSRDAGTHQVRHFSQPVRAWRMLPEPLTSEAAASSSA